MLAHSFDRFYVVTKFEMPKIKDLKLTMFFFQPYMQSFEYFQSLYAKIHKTLQKNCTLCKVLQETNRVI